MVIAAVLGMGVAVITSMSGTPVRPLVPQRRPLLDTEAVLLVDDDHSQRSEHHIVLDQGVRADHDVDGPVFESGSDLLAGGGLHLAGQQLDPDRAVPERRVQVRHGQILEQSAQAGCMLLGEHLGRGHQRTLMTALDGHEE
jgi:hypothetical protein